MFARQDIWSNGVAQYTTAKHPEHKWDYLPVVAETYDGFLNDIQGRHVHYPDVEAALDAAHDGPVEEGNVGGGTGMVCFRFKCGIGTSSRQLPASEGGYKIGVLVQANFGSREQLTVDGVPVGRELTDYVPPSEGKDGSIVVVIGTDAPVSSVRTTGAHRPPSRFGPGTYGKPLFRATVEATEEGILNALTMGKTMQGVDGHVAYQLPYDRLAAMMAKYGRPLAPASH